jgi:hypothetical protein
MSSSIPGSREKMSRRRGGEAPHPELPQPPIDDPYPRWYHPERSGNGVLFFEKFIGEKVLTE